MQRRLSNTADVKFFVLDYNKVMVALKKYAKMAIARGARAVFLIGSLARGDYTTFSDADIVIIADDVPKRPIDRLVDFMDPLVPMDIDLMVYTTEEILKMAREKRRIIREIVKYGKLLAGDETVLDHIRHYFKAEH